MHHLRSSQQQHCFVCSGKHLALSNAFLSRTQTHSTTTKTTIQDSARGSASCVFSSSSSTSEDVSNNPALMIALACSILSPNINLMAHTLRRVALCVSNAHEVVVEALHHETLFC